MGMSRIVETLIWRLKERRHRWAARAVLDTPPVVPSQDDDGLILFAMVGSRVLLPFLVAAKSLRQGLGRGRFVVMDDGSLTDADRVTIGVHLGAPRIIPIASVETGLCPRGGTWERLLTILDLRAGAYVIQCDSDTVTCGPLSEVTEAIAAGRSFMLRGEAGAERHRVSAFAPTRRQRDPAARVHVQDKIEAAMDALRIPGLVDPFYVRGCSGFAGFAPSAAGRGLAEAFSSEAERLVGSARWREWGTEQVTSNFIIANEPDPLLLPYDRYLNHWNAPVPASRRFVHFIGTWRFSRGAYLRETKAAIARLRGAEGVSPAA